MLKKLIALSGLKVAMAITLVIVTTFIYNTVVSDPTGSFLNLLDKKWVDFIVKARPVQPHSPEVVIATIDTKAVDKYGRWPWPRTRMAELVDALNKYYNVATIGFDIVFSEPDQTSAIPVTDEYRKVFSKLGFSESAKAVRFVRYLKNRRNQLDGDKRFGRSLGSKKNAILGYFFFSNPANLKHLTDEDLRESAERISGSEISLLKGVVPDGALPAGYAAETNIPAISKGGILSGNFNMTPDVEDGTVRRVHLLMKYGDNYYPTLVLQMFKHYMGADNIIVESDEESGISAIVVGNQVILPDADGSILLNYKGPEQTFPHYSIYDIIEHIIPKEQLEDKIVLIGATEVGIFDLRNTPVGGTYPGVEVHATLLDNLLTQPEMEFAGPGTYFKLSDANHGVTVIFIIVFGLILGIVLPRVRATYSAVFALGLLLAYLFGQRWMVMNLLTWTSAIYVALVIVMVWAGVTLFQFLVSDKDKRFIKNAFQQYLSPDVISQLMDDPNMLKLGGERREMTAFFSDVAGFSSISELLTPEELVQLLNQYLTAMSNIIMEYGGTVDKYEGDAIIAFFGAPVHYEDHAIRGCMVTIDMQAKLDELREIWLAEGKPRIDHRIGLNTGQMVVGNMGSEDRFDYTMMGNSVNLAARLEGANKNYGTYSMISEFTYEPAKDAIEARELDLIRVIGINTPVRVYELAAKKGELDEKRQKAFPYFAKGLELYRKQEWDEAIKYFNATEKLIPDDPPSKVYIERCEAFKANPPEEKDWDGVFTATEK
ncbi:MAG: adenylate/guanylate cyclase domain-containing protein [SAR324 cluster bacterium]|nr:adenylate/guanylate cyclase domain-containing protein [SAR324 cluster bacterium]MCZ6556336.1 adenylate/guanylate cyclase domain-containing protein [SAR324 cluster bacterium]MCZ6627633.1 adenylate/guanylate cyclase domain-containing protein [SAR324 cluster bacterium]MCZ6645393.1 adenylate/guanylate cyclase domain-containing protein [SAR324 cluster bacterium]